MCGIFGIALGGTETISHAVASAALCDLFRYSQSRGKEASGVALFRNGVVDVTKSSKAPKEFIQSKEYNDLFRSECATSWDGPLCVIGHSRLVTDGTSCEFNNNQPVSVEGCHCVHNGIIVNDDILWARYPILKRNSEIDTEILVRLFSEFSKSMSPLKSIDKTYSQLEGTASVSIIDSVGQKLILATNCGSLYYVHDETNKMLIFASEKYILKQVVHKISSIRTPIRHMKANNAVELCLKTFQVGKIGLKMPQSYESSKISRKSGHSFKNALENINRGSSDELLWLCPDISHLRRCTRCVLPETMPFIEYDEDGVCNYCNNYRKQEMEGKDKLLEVLDKHRKSNGDPDCIVAFSGGRDSSYGLHKLKKEFGMNPIAYSYDWGVLTDIARRNQARMCGQLGLEHIIVSADIRKKRKNIRKNIDAWATDPDLGMIPIFMAGDKQFFHYANKVKEQTGIKLLIFCQNFLERVDFKAGFSGINNIGFTDKLVEGKRHTTMSTLNKFRIATYYLTRFLKNPRYLNRSLGDTAWAYLSYYFIRQEHLYLFQYIPWIEEEVDRVLVNEYDWEVASDTKTTWRIGDGTAAFYNYIYRTICGFTENDGLRSNQIREGLMTRDEALLKIEEENEPRYDAIIEYLDMIQVDYKRVIESINSACRLY